MDKRPKIAIFLATSGHSGVERVMGNLIKGLGGFGIHMDLIRIEGHGPYLEETPPNVRVIQLRVRHVNASIPHLIRYLRDVRPDALLTDKDRVNRAAIFARLLARANTTRLVLRIGTTVSENLKRRPFWARHSQLTSIRRLYPLAQAILVPSEGAREDLLTIAPSLQGKVFKVASPIVDESIYKRAKEQVDHPWLMEQRDQPLVLGVGELCERKDFPTLIRAFHLVRKRVDARLIILGKGKKREELMALTRRLGIGPYVDLPGFVKNPLAYMKKAHCLCLTSRCEGMPVVLIEALALGRPVCATDCPSGPREILKGGKVGRLVKVGDYKALSEAIIETLKAPPSSATLRTAIKDFTIKNGTKDYLSHLLPQYNC